MTETWCEWWDRPLKDVEEWQTERCEEFGKHCDGCGDRSEKEKEGKE